jgi:hypothetical protein
MIAGIVAGLFFPLAGLLGLPPRSTVTVLMLRKSVWAGSTLGGFAMAEEAIGKLLGVSISAKRIRRMVQEVGAERVAERNAAVAEFRQMETRCIP